jgi:hypothetical protein
VQRRVCACASNGMHWFNPITRTTSDQLRHALMLSTTARSKPWYRTVLRLSGVDSLMGMVAKLREF